MSQKQSHEMEGSLKECLRELSTALGNKDYHVQGDQITVHEGGGKELVISLVYEGDRKLGSLDLPMTQVNYEFNGYSDGEAKAFMTHISEHMLRAGGG